MEKNKLLSKNLLGFILAFISIFGLCNFFHISSLFVSLILFFALFCIIKKIDIEPKKNLSWIIFAAIFAITQVVSEKVRYSNAPEYMSSISLKDILSIISIFVVVVVICLFFELKIPTKNSSANTTIIPRCFWLISAGILFVCWMPYFLTYYPGIVQPDSLNSIGQSLGEIPFNNHHPVLFTLIVKLFISIGNTVNNINIGIALFSLFQMLVTAVCLSRAVLLFLENNKNFAAILSVLFFAVNPLIAVYSFSMIKDVLFSDILLLFIILITKIVLSKAQVLKQKRFIVKFLLCSTLLCFLRNGTIIIAVCSLLLILLFYREHWKRILALLLSVLAFVFTIQTPVFYALDIRKGHFAESVGIPLQQISYVIINNGNMSENDIEEFEKIVPVSTVKEKYSPSLSDPIKFSSDFNNDYLDSHKIHFLMLWMRIGMKNIPKYVKSWIVSTKSFYDIQNRGISTEYKVYDNDYGIKSKNIIKSIIGLDISGICEKMIKYPGDANIPIFSSLVSIPCLVWLILFAAVLSIRRKQFNLLLVLAPPFLAFLMMLIAAPCFDTRYLLICIFSLPIVFGIIDRNIDLAE